MPHYCTVGMLYRLRLLADCVPSPGHKNAAGRPLLGGHARFLPSTSGAFPPMRSPCGLVLGGSGETLSSFLPSCATSPDAGQYSPPNQSDLMNYVRMWASQYKVGVPHISLERRWWVLLLQWTSSAAYGVDSNACGFARAWRNTRGSDLSSVNLLTTCWAWILVAVALSSRRPVGDEDPRQEDCPQVAEGCQGSVRCRLIGRRRPQGRR